MSPEFIKFVPLATMLVALVIGVAIDPTSARPIWWAVPAGLGIGLVLQLILRRTNRAR